jgi:molybdenum cofactor cytidylyltransferase
LPRWTKIDFRSPDSYAGERYMNGKHRKNGVSAIVLAAGMSRRMGTPKQLLCIDGETILGRTLGNVRASAVSEIVLVLGHAAADVEKEISTAGLKIVHNREYQQGMGTSLRTGLAALDAGTNAALIILADQPFVSPETLNKLIACHEESRPQIIIPMYKGFRGNPVLLDRMVFPELNALSGDVGCRAIFGSHTENIRKLEVDDLGILLDIDSREEYRKLAHEAKAGSLSDAAPALESRESTPEGRPELIVVGRDAVAEALVKLGQLLKFTVTVVDPLLTLKEMPGADRILRVLDFSLLPPADERHVVVASRGQFDEEAIEQALRIDARYVALLANRKRAEAIVQTLKVRSFAPEKLAGVRAPAGLDIGADSPEEIALSIMAEVVAARRGLTKGKV